MSNDETYNGWKNRETWAFNLHWSNDQGLHSLVLEFAKENSEPGDSDRAVGESVVTYVKDMLFAEDGDFGGITDAAKLVIQDVGSFWRIDEAEVGRSVRESLDEE